MKRRTVLLGSGAIAGAAWGTSGIASSLAQEKKTPDLFSRRLRGQKVEIAKAMAGSKGLSGYYVAPVRKSQLAKFPAVVVLMEAFGLNAQIQGICDMFARYGYAAIAPDFYQGATYAYTNIAGAVEKLKTLQDDSVMREVGQTLDWLARQREIQSDRIGTVGFCMGGRFAFLANSAHVGRIKAAVSFYGGGIADEADPIGRPALLNQVSAMRSPLLLIYGAEDELIKREEHKKITEALSTAKQRYTLTVFPEAKHGFANSERKDAYNEAAANEAWDMTFGFFKRYLKERKEKL
ncbi:MAG: dienelactone hydrolase family protein [Synechococcales bacterium]|nr:dienelactone hydrolase family protein [Synechococcales bacterium]